MDEATKQSRSPLARWVVNGGIARGKRGQFLPLGRVQFRKVPVPECEHTATVTATIPEDSGRSETQGFVGSDLTAYRTWLAVPATLGLSLRTPSVAKDDDLTIFAQRIVPLRQRNAILHLPSLFVSLPRLLHTLWRPSFAPSFPSFFRFDCVHGPWSTIHHLGEYPPRISKLNSGSFFLSFSFFFLSFVLSFFLSSFGRNGPR